MATAEHREPCDSRGSCTVLGAPRGEIPSGDSTNREGPSIGAAPPVKLQQRTCSLTGPLQPVSAKGGCPRQADGTAGLPSAPEMPCAPKWLRLVPTRDILRMYAPPVRADDPVAISRQSRMSGKAIGTAALKRSCGPGHETAAPARYWRRRIQKRSGDSEGGRIWWSQRSGRRGRRHPRRLRNGRQDRPIEDRSLPIAVPAKARRDRPIFRASGVVARLA